MKTVTFQVLDGIDKGRVFRDMAVPITIGREEGNVLRLNDERVSRYHAKVQFDAGDVILTDLDSTNGTRVNGLPVQIRRLRPGDQIAIGRSTLLFGSYAEITIRQNDAQPISKSVSRPIDKTIGDLSMLEDEVDEDFSLEVAEEKLKLDPPDWSPKDSDLPPLPGKLTPAQSARLAEIFDYLHQGLVSASNAVQTPEDAVDVRVPFAEWQKIQAVQMIMARYVRGVAEPDTLTE